MDISLKNGSIFHKRYLIKGMIGSGAMGAVYEAEQTDAKRTVALKLLNLDLISSDDDRARFLRECQVLSRISHKNIVCFYSAAISDEGIPYSVCELVRGKTLRALLRDQENEKLSWVDTVDIIRQIATGMNEAHAENIIHRDLKPENIMLVDHVKGDQPSSGVRSEKYLVKVLDFGLSKLQVLDSQKPASLTQTGTLIGTVHYMSPEQCKGSAVDSRSDIYSLGCIAYECVAGKKLFDAESSIGVLHQHVNSPIDAALNELSANCPAGFIYALRKMLAKNRDDRFQNMEELIQELNNDLHELDNESLSQKHNSQIKGRNLAFGILAFTILLLLVWNTYFHQTTRSNSTINTKSASSPKKIMNGSLAGKNLRELGLNESPEHDLDILEKWLTDNRRYFFLHPTTTENPYAELAEGYEKLANLRKEANQPTRGLAVGKLISSDMYFRLKGKNSDYSDSVTRDTVQQFLLLLRIAVADRQFNSASKIIRKIEQSELDSRSRNTLAVQAYKLIDEKLAQDDAPLEQRLKMISNRISSSREEHGQPAPELLPLILIETYLQNGLGNDKSAFERAKTALSLIGKGNTEALLPMAAIGNILNQIGQSQYFIDAFTARFEPSKIQKSNGGAAASLELASAYRNSGDLKNAMSVLIAVSDGVSESRTPESKDLYSMANGELVALALITGKEKELSNYLSKAFDDKIADLSIVMLQITTVFNNDDILYQKFYKQAGKFENRFPLDFGILRVQHAHVLRANDLRVNDALSEYQKGIEDFTRFGRFYTGTLTAYCGKALCYITKKDLKAAQQCIDDARNYFPEEAKNDPGIQAVDRIEATIVLKSKGAEASRKLLDKLEQSLELKLSQSVDPYNSMPSTVIALTESYSERLALLKYSKDYGLTHHLLRSQAATLKRLKISGDPPKKDLYGRIRRAFYLLRCGETLESANDKAAAKECFVHALELNKSDGNNPERDSIQNWIEGGLKRVSP